MASNRNITINIGPQDPEAWLCISLAIAAVAFFWCMAQPDAHLNDKPAKAKASVELHVGAKP